MRRMLPLLDPFDEIKQIYYSTTRETIERDLARALELLRRMPDDEARQRAAGLMHGLSELKREWAGRKKSKKPTSKDPTSKELTSKGPTSKGPTSPWFLEVGSRRFCDEDLVLVAPDPPLAALERRD